MPQFEQVSVFSSLIFWSLISFAIFFILLKKYAFPPILQALEDRRNKIKGDISDAEKLKEEARLLKEDFERQLKKAHENANTIVKMATEESRKIQEKTLRDTQTKCKQMQDDAENEIKRTKNKLLKDIRGHVAALTIASAEKILKKTIGEGDNKRLVDESIEEVLQELERNPQAF